MTNNKTTMKKEFPVFEIWKTYGLSESDFLALARISNHVAKDRIEVVTMLPLSSKDDKLGLEVLFGRRNSAYSLSLASMSRELFLKFYRNQDRGVDRFIKGHIDRWETIANQMIHLR
jgi:hypothetical protein